MLPETLKSQKSRGSLTAHPSENPKASALDIIKAKQINQLKQTGEHVKAKKFTS